MKKITVDDLKEFLDCYDDDIYCQDDLFFDYFVQTYENWDWRETASEGVRILNETLFKGCPIPSRSPLLSIIYGVAAHAANGAFASVAASLGINDVESFASVVNDEYGDRNNLPPPTTLKKLLDKVEENIAEQARI